VEAPRANAFSSRRPVERGTLTCFLVAWWAGRYHPLRSCLAACLKANERPVNGLTPCLRGTARGLLDPFFVGTRVEATVGRTEECTRLACDLIFLITCARRLRVSGAALRQRCSSTAQLASYRWQTLTCDRITRNIIGGADIAATHLFARVQVVELRLGRVENGGCVRICSSDLRDGSRRRLGGWWPGYRWR
jgi:hypothetical protein